jgi:hypothetical protein
VSTSAVQILKPPILHVALSKQQVIAGPDLNIRGLLVRAVNQSSSIENGVGHLQKATAVIGYAVQTEDGTIGHVRDVLVDDQAWYVRYLVVNTEKRWAGKKVLVAPAWLTHVAWDASTFRCIVTAIDRSGAEWHRRRNAAGGY